MARSWPGGLDVRDHDVDQVRSVLGDGASEMHFVAALDSVPEMRAVWFVKHVLTPESTSVRIKAWRPLGMSSPFRDQDR
jgi:hypothetical protein